MSGQDIEDEFVRVIHQWNSTLFTDSAQVRSIYAHAAAYVLRRLERSLTKREWQAIREDFTEFAQSPAYRGDGRGRNLDESP